MFITDFMSQKSISKENIAFIGDDLNDISAMKLCSFVGCPADSCYEVKQIADYVSDISGGHGAVRDIVEQYLRKMNLWDTAINIAYQMGK